MWLVGAGLVCAGVLVWMIAAGPGYLGYGASLLWTGPRRMCPAVRDQGDAGRCGGAAQQRPVGDGAGDRAEDEQGQLFARYESASKVGAGGDAAAGCTVSGFQFRCLRDLPETWSTTCRRAR